MKKIILATVLTAASLGAMANMGVYVGVTYSFGDSNGVGLTLQGTTTRKADSAFAAAGVTYYPTAPAAKLGIPVGVGYQSKHAAVVGSYDFLLNAPAISAGYANATATGK